MEEKKKLTNWKTALIYFFITYIFVVVLNLLILSVTSFALSQFFILSPNSVYILEVIIGIFSLWFGVMYSANYLKKNCIIENKNRIIRLGVIYYIVVSCFKFTAIPLGVIIQGGVEALGKNLIYLNPILIGALVATIIYITLFFLFSKKYLKTTKELNNGH